MSKFSNAAEEYLRCYDDVQALTLEARFADRKSENAREKLAGIRSKLAEHVGLNSKERSAYIDGRVVCVKYKPDSSGPTAESVDVTVLCPEKP